MTTSRFRTTLFALIANVALMFITPLQAQVEIDESQGISYLAGGVGLEEREAVERLARFFNLKLTFAEKAGNYVGDVRVVISKPGGERVTEILAKGPLLYVALPTGRYEVEATYEARPQTRSVTVADPPQKTTQLFMW